MFRKLFNPFTFVFCALVAAVYLGSVPENAKADSFTRDTANQSEGKYVFTFNDLTAGAGHTSIPGSIVSATAIPVQGFTKIRFQIYDKVNNATDTNIAGNNVYANSVWLKGSANGVNIASASYGNVAISSATNPSVNVLWTQSFGVYQGDIAGLDAIQFVHQPKIASATLLPVTFEVHVRLYND